MECDELTEPEDQPEYDDDQPEDAEDDEELLRFGGYQRNIVIDSMLFETEAMQAGASVCTPCRANAGTCRKPYDCLIHHARGPRHLKLGRKLVLSERRGPCEPASLWGSLEFPAPLALPVSAPASGFFEPLHWKLFSF